MINPTTPPLWERWLKGLFGGFAAVLLFAMMSLTFIDVILRYWFNAPIPGGFEVTELLLASLIFCGLPLVTMENEHVSVDLFDKFIPGSWRRWQDLVILIACNVCVGVLAWRMWLKARESQGYGDITSVLELPLAPVFFLASFALAITVVIFLILLLRRVKSDRISPSEHIPNA
ncbi:MAG: TRAP transporter small permease subunit [Gammaproteobacteria bacterium]|nr:TRAP transporter small permease subunit [Gammaproteobacteria bacterium]